MCRAYIERWFYNKQSGKCEIFVWGGCDGNENNFSSKLKCEKRCGNGQNQESEDNDDVGFRLIEKESDAVIFEQEDEDVCQLSSDAGPCRAAFEKYFYNKDTKSCETFIYGGCDGNGNRFDNVEDCQNKCGEKESRSDSISMKEVCAMPSETGPCRAMMTKYFYNSATGNCEEFVYGGCDGNENNFDTKEICESRCIPIKESIIFNSEDICALPSEPGPCEAAMQRYFYNLETESCEPFTYGGCDGNENNFKTKSDCQDKCVQSDFSVIGSVSICSLPSDVGPCRAAMQRYYFNWETQSCEMFIYGGCEGNDNNFESQESCQEKCKLRRP